MAFLQPQTPRQPIFQAPAIVLWLIGTLAGAHGLRLLLSQARSQDLIYAYGLVPARYSRTFLESHMADPGTMPERVIPFVSYMGLHSDWTHLVINCLWLLAFGPIVARRWGGALFLVFFIMCGVAGAGAYMALNWGSAVPVVGASGAISGLMAAAIRMMPGSAAPWITVAGEPKLAPLFSRQIMMFTAVWAVINFLAAMIDLGGGGERGLIAWQAHLGGFIAGLVTAGIFDALRPRTVAVHLEN
jgi:membrane associated rhomboid family serine protease